MKRGRALILVVAVGVLVACDDGTPSGRGETHTVVTDDARGLRAGASVYISGVEAGEVRAVRLDGDDRASITFVLDERSGALPAVRRETCAKIASYGLAGEQHLELMPGPRSEPLLGEAAITCVEDGGTDPMMRSMTEIVEHIAAGRGTLGRLVRDPEVAETLVRFLEGRCTPAPEEEEHGGSEGNANEADTPGDVVH